MSRAKNTRSTNRYRMISTWDVLGTVAALLLLLKILSEVDPEILGSGPLLSTKKCSVESRSSVETDTATEIS